MVPKICSTVCLKTFTGYRLSRRIGEIEEFQFEPLSEGNQLHLTVAVSGWLCEETEGLDRK